MWEEIRELCRGRRVGYLFPNDLFMRSMSGLDDKRNKKRRSGLTFYVPWTIDFLWFVEADNVSFNAQEACRFFHQHIHLLVVRVHCYGAIRTAVNQSILSLHEPT